MFGRVFGEKYEQVERCDVYIKVRELVERTRFRNLHQPRYAFKPTATVQSTLSSSIQRLRHTSFALGIPSSASSPYSTLHHLALQHLQPNVHNVQEGFLRLLQYVTFHRSFA
jgi:hypothetical protein